MTLIDMQPTPNAALRHPLEPWLWPASAAQLPGGDLTIGGVRLVDVADRHATPAYVVDTSEFRSRCIAYADAFSGEQVAYASKALLTRAIARIVNETGLFLDVCSEGELAMAESVDFPMSRVILHGNAKSAGLISEAVTAGVGRIVIDSLGEIALIAAHVGMDGGRQGVLVRVTPGIDPHTHTAVTTGTENQKFGLSIKDGSAVDAVRRVLAQPELELLGVHCHLGSQISSTMPYERAVRRLVEFLAEIRDAHGVALPELNLGGGHAIAYVPDDVPLAVHDVAHAVRHELVNSCGARRLPVPRLTVEPGRAIAGPSGVTIYRVRTVKHSGGRTWVAVDGGMSDNLRPALYGAPYTARLVGRQSCAVEEHVVVVGRHCEAGDVLINDALLPGDLRPGDLLVVPATGAYHHSMANNYNMATRPPVIGVEGGRMTELVRRETVDDLLRRDLG